MIPRTQSRRQRPELEHLFRAIAAGDRADVARRLLASPELAYRATRVGASRQAATSYFLQSIGRYIYAGDTALHIAAAAYRADIADDLVTRGADVRARNRRGAEPLHSASVGMPGSRTWQPEAQAAIIEYLVRAGADPNAADMNGVTPLHRAVRTRCAAAVRVLLAVGADVRRPNGSGSTPLHLAVQNTGRGGTGAEEARAQQAEIVRLLAEHGARPTDTDGGNKTVMESIAAAWLRDFVREQLGWR
jgi:Ankyrin repeats (3 copies)/Ankyrin repeat